MEADWDSGGRVLAVPGPAVPGEPGRGPADLLLCALMTYELSLHPERYNSSPLAPYRCRPLLREESMPKRENSSVLIRYPEPQRSAFRIPLERRSRTEGSSVCMTRASSAIV